jgi:hypothetical protein
MSSGNGAAGSTAVFIRDAQDVTLQLKRRLVNQDFTRGVPLNTIPNGVDSYMTFLFGRMAAGSKDYNIAAGCGSCTGLPFQKRDARLFR